MEIKSRLDCEKFKYSHRGNFKLVGVQRKTGGEAKKPSKIIELKMVCVIKVMTSAIALIDIVGYFFSISFRNALQLCLVTHLYVELSDFSSTATFSKRGELRAQ